MGFYSRVIFPRVLDFAMRDKEMQKVRGEVLADVTGDVFEIGFGTGLNLGYYPESIREITTIDVNPGCSKLAARRIAESRITVHHRVLDAESLPMDDESFDSVVCTWTLCSIPNVERALSEVRRVLRPGGKLFFVEHGLADDPKVQKWQHRLTPIWKIVGDGCHLARDAGTLIQDMKFSIAKLENYYLPKAPRFAGYLYQGVATKA